MPKNKLERRLLGVKRAKRVVDVHSRRWFDHILYRIDEDREKRERQRAFGRLVHTRAPCSCEMCGNPRRTMGELTRQEKFIEWEMEEELKVLE